MNPPLAVIRYLAELDAALAARNAPDRDQIVTQIGEHIGQALADLRDPSDADIAAVLAELGDPLRIADEAAPAAVPAAPAAAPAPQGETNFGSGPAPAVTYRPAAPKPSLLARSWIPVVAVALWVVGAAAALAPLLLVATSPMGGIPTGFVLLSVLLNIPLIASVILVFISPLFHPLGRWSWLLSVPVTILIEMVAARSGVQHSPYALDAAIVWAIIVACPIAAAGAATMITIRAYRRAEASAPSFPPTAQPVSC